jgi:hypothetical protein
MSAEGRVWSFGRFFPLTVAFLSVASAASAAGASTGERGPKVQKGDQGVWTTVSRIKVDRPPPGPRVLVDDQGNAYHEVLVNVQRRGNNEVLRMAFRDPHDPWMDIPIDPDREYEITVREKSPLQYDYLRIRLGEKTIYESGEKTPSGSVRESLLGVNPYSLHPGESKKQNPVPAKRAVRGGPILPGSQNEKKNLAAVARTVERGAHVTTKMFLAKLDPKTGRSASVQPIGELYSTAESFDRTPEGGFAVTGFKRLPGQKETRKSFLLKLDRKLGVEWEHTYDLDGTGVMARHLADGSFLLLVRDGENRFFVIPTDRTGAWKDRTILGDKTEGDAAFVIVTDASDLILVTSVKGVPASHLRRDRPGSKIACISPNGTVKWKKNLEDVRILTGVGVEKGGFIAGGARYPEFEEVLKKFPELGREAPPRDLKPGHPDLRPEHLALMKKLSSLKTMNKELAFVARFNSKGEREWSEEFGTGVKHEMPTVPMRYPGVVDQINRYIKIWYQRWTEWDNRAISMERLENGDVFVYSIARSYDGTVNSGSVAEAKQGSSSLLRLTPSGKKVWEYTKGKALPEFVTRIEGDGIFVLNPSRLEKISPKGGQEWLVETRDALGGAVQESGPEKTTFAGLTSGPDAGLLALFNKEVPEKPAAQMPPGVPGPPHRPR